jgi:hypothetical protein
LESANQIDSRLPLFLVPAGSQAHASFILHATPQLGFVDVTRNLPRSRSTIELFLRPIPHSQPV